MLAACGRTLQESNGSFFSPSPRNSIAEAAGERCEWRISATHGEKIILNITELDLPASAACERDYLEVRDGHWLKSPLLGTHAPRLPAPCCAVSHVRRPMPCTPCPAPHAPRPVPCAPRPVPGAPCHVPRAPCPAPRAPHPTPRAPHQAAMPRGPRPAPRALRPVYRPLLSGCGDVLQSYRRSSVFAGRFCGSKLPPVLVSSESRMWIEYRASTRIIHRGFFAKYEGSTH